MKPISIDCFGLDTDGGHVRRICVDKICTNEPIHRIAKQAPLNLIHVNLPPETIASMRKLADDRFERVEVV